MLSKEELKIKNLFKIKNSEIKTPSGSFEHTLKKNDILPMLIITVIYAVVALIGLGDKTCPQSFYSLPQRGSDVIIIPTQPTKLSGCSLYSGLGENTYYFQGSEDGINYIDIGQLTPKGVFRWEKMEFYYIDTPFRALRVIVNGEMQLGELVLYDGDGTQMPTSALTVSENGAALFDEAETVPKKVSYRNGTYFDEVYHARTAYEHINGIAPYEISHPPLGKLIISIGVRLFGMTPFGWRFMGALLGVLMLPLLYTLLKCLFGNTLISVCGTVVFAFDFMHFVQTRIATIDSYAVFFILLMYLCFYLFLRSDKLGQPAWKSRLPLALAGLFFGIGCACKWTVLYGGIGLGVLWLMHWVGRLHTEGKTAQQAFWSNVRWCLLFFVAVPLFVYYISYTPYGTAVGLQGAKMYFSRDYLSIVLENQSYMLHYHSSLSSEHIYSSRWYEWILDLRPMLYWVEKSEGISASIAAFVSPLLCWGGLASVGATAYLGVRRKDTRALFLVVGYLAQLLPWAFVSRTTFVYHYFACTVFLTLCLCYVLNYLREKGYCWKGFAWGISSASIGLFVVFYPILSGTAVSDSYQNFLRWMPKFWKF